MEKPIGIILAAGRGTRMRELTATLPKPLLLVRGKTLLEHVLEPLAKEVSQIVIVIGYLGEHIKTHVGDSWGKVKVVYAVQKNPAGGTLDALRVGLEKINGETTGYIVVSADDIHTAFAFEALGIHAQEHKDRMLLVGARMQDKEQIKKFGVFVFDEEGKISNIEEKPAHPPSEFINCGMYYFPKAFRAVAQSPIESAPNGELYLTSAIDAWINQHGADFVEVLSWEAMGTPEDIAQANRRD